MELKRQKVKFFSKNYRDVKNLYFTAFPAVERLPYFPLFLNTCRSLADFYAYYDGDTFVGLAYLLQNEEVIYLFFLAVNPQIRSQGYGSAILKDISALAEERPIVLAMEPLDKGADNYEQRLKRVNFYERNGFSITDYNYHEGAEVYQMMATKSDIDIHLVEKLTEKAVLGLIPVSFDQKINENAI